MSRVDDKNIGPGGNPRPVSFVTGVPCVVVWVYLGAKLLGQDRYYPDRIQRNRIKNPGR